MPVFQLSLVVRISNLWQVWGLEQERMRYWCAATDGETREGRI